MLTLSLLVAVIGLVLYLLTITPKVNEAGLNEVGRIMFFAGLLAFLMSAIGARVLV